jgi:hypothetical protein
MCVSKTSDGSSSSSSSFSLLAVSCRGDIHIETTVRVTIDSPCDDLALLVCLPGFGHQSVAWTAPPSRLHYPHFVVVQFRWHLLGPHIALSVLRVVLSRIAVSVVVRVVFVIITITTIIVVNNKNDDETEHDSPTGPTRLFSGH